VKIYKTNIKKYKAEISALENVIFRLSLVRFATFLISLVSIVYLANERMILALWFVVPVCVFAFIFLLNRYNHLNDRKRNATDLKEINENELLRIENKLSGFPMGQPYLNRDHAYVADLDIFGPHSLFQLLNRTTTESGSHLLAMWLSAPSPKETIIERQHAIQELKPSLQWRQQFQSAGQPYINSESDFQKLLKWFESKEYLLPKQTKYILGSIFLAVLTSVFVGLYVQYSIAEGLNVYLLPLLLVLMFNHFLLKKVAPIAEEIIDHTHQNVQILGGYESLAQTIVSESFNSKKLTNLQSDLTQRESSANKEIKRLKDLLEGFQLRGSKSSSGNMFYKILNQFWLLDIFYIIKVENWKVRNRDQVHSWIEAISEFEVLNSLSGFAYSNPDFTFPEIDDEQYNIKFENVGHPLIKRENRISNNFDMRGRGHISMITGSNMAGKSTFLRTVGINLILALMGAPCCAKSAKVSNMKLFTSMRTQDNLEEGVSSFYAELQRVKQLLKFIEGGQPIFFMLDEMFKGTNSEDRYKGGVSLIKQLSELNTFGIISTHDLDLAKLVGKNMKVLSYSFNSTIHEGELKFNYKLQDGICTDFNASELMKKSGIKILPDIETITDLRA